MSRKNPNIGIHPDLFVGESPTWVPVADLTRKQLLALPRSAYRDDEWDELDDDIREYIYDHDEASKARIHFFVRPFINIYEWEVADVTDALLLEQHGEDFHNWLASTGDPIDHADKQEVDEVVEHYVGLGFDEEDVRSRINEAMADTSNYEEDIGSCRRDPTEVYNSQIRQHLYVDIDHEFTMAVAGGDPVDMSLKEAYDALHPDELVRAIEHVNNETDDAWWLTDERVERTMKARPDGYRGGTFDATVELDKCVVATPKWEWIKGDLNDEFEVSIRPVEDDPAAAPAPPEEGRIFHRFKDGAYVLELHPSELAAESRALGMCVGDPKYGYGDAIADGETKILSLRTAGGRPKLTFEVSVDEGVPTVVEQIKGKANRLPGWDRAREGEGKMKADEVQKAITVVHQLGLDPYAVDDLEPALDHMEHKPNPRGRHRRRRSKQHCGFCCRVG